MGKPLETPPPFSRRITNAEELCLAVIEAASAAQMPGADIAFNGVVRLDMADGQPILTILKRSA